MSDVHIGDTVILSDAPWASIRGATGTVLMVAGDPSNPEKIIDEDNGGVLRPDVQMAFAPEGSVFVKLDDGRTLDYFGENYSIVGVEPQEFTVVTHNEQEAA